jgi:hypothetical protein
MEAHEDVKYAELLEKPIVLDANAKDHVTP